MAFKPFMTYWKRFFKAVQILYLSLAFLTLQAHTCYLIYVKQALDRDEIVASHEDDEDLDSSNYTFSEQTLFGIKCAMVTMVASLLVTNFLTYRAHLLTAGAFKGIKMQYVNIEGYQYKKSLRCLNVLFILSQSYKLRYEKYVAYVNKHTASYVKRAMIAQVIFIGSILAFDFIQPYAIEEFAIPLSYYIGLIAMDFPKAVLFIVKVVLFPIVFGIHRLFMVFDATCCGAKQYPMHRSVAEDLELDRWIRDDAK